jgi:serine/threonine-protein kinase
MADTGEEKRPSKDAVFGELAVERGHIRPEDLAVALEDQEFLKQRGLTQSLAQILVTKGLLDKVQFKDLRREVSVRIGEASYVGEFEVLSELGRGGMGVVFKARRRDSDEIVALKVLPKHAATEALIARFKRESEIVQSLDHPNLVRCRGWGVDERRKCHYCALEFVDGRDLGKVLKETGGLQERAAVAIAWQIAEALNHAHANGLVHRDIKPENIMVTVDGTAKLLDLGLARPTDLEATRHTQTGVFVGSPYYASPEQITAGNTVDGRSDIYSLGATLYHMVTGRVPYDGTTAIEILHKHLQATPVPPRDIKPGLTAELCGIIEKAMARNREARHQSIDEVLRAFAALPYPARPEIGGTRSMYGVNLIGALPGQADAKKDSVHDEQWRELKEREAIVEQAKKPAQYRILCFACGEHHDIRDTMPVVVDATERGAALELLCETCMQSFPSAFSCEMCGRRYDPRFMPGVRTALEIDAWVCPWCFPWHLSQQALASAWLRRRGTS